MARIGIRWEVADRILNHVGGAVSGVAAIYQRHEWINERKDALDQWAAHVLSCGGEAMGQTPDEPDTGPETLTGCDIIGSTDIGLPRDAEQFQSRKDQNEHA